MGFEDWPETTATISGCCWEEPPCQGWRSLFVGHFTVAYSYLVDGSQYRGEFYSSFEWKEGTDLPILYNLESPGESCVCDEDERRAACEWVLGFFEMMMDLGP
jgi:hypothetical protein